MFFFFLTTPPSPQKKTQLYLLYPMRNVTVKRLPSADRKRVGMVAAKRLSGVVNMSHGGHRDVSLSTPVSSRYTTPLSQLRNCGRRFSCSFRGRRRRSTPRMGSCAPPSPTLHPPTYPHYVKTDDAQPAGATASPA